MEFETIRSSDPGVWRLTAPNPGPLTLDGTNTYVVGISPSFIIDPGPGLDVHIDAIAETVRRKGAVVEGVLLTHGHPDHAEGAGRLGRLLGSRVWASDAMPESTAESMGVTDRFAGGHRFQLAGHQLEVIPTPGHSPEHVAFWLADERMLFAGDTVLGTGSTLIAPPEGNMVAYVSTLQALRSLHPHVIAPGHGPLVQNALASIDENLEHRRRRELQILTVLSEGTASVDDIVRRVYADVSPSLHGMASGSVRAQLEKLVREGRVRQNSGNYSLSS